MKSTPSYTQHVIYDFYCLFFPDPNVLDKVKRNEKKHETQTNNAEKKKSRKKQIFATKVEDERTINSMSHND